tara:strand:+ start:1893 stop:2072 length:180 start_codon:yes stop_codon:yes gene_type:complete
MEEVKKGITERVKEATTVEEISTLENEITTYKYAHPSTVRKFNKRAKARKKFLEKNNGK